MNLNPSFTTEQKIMMSFSKHNNHSPNSKFSRKIDSNDASFSEKPPLKLLKSDSLVSKKTPSNLFLMSLVKRPLENKPKKVKWYTKILRIMKKTKSKNKKIGNKPNASPSHNERLQNMVNMDNEGLHYSDSDKKRRNFLIIVYMVKKFIQIIKTYTFVKKIFRLKTYHFNAIGDNSNFYTRGSEFGDLFFGNLTNRSSQNYVRKF